MYVYMYVCMFRSLEDLNDGFSSKKIPPYRAREDSRSYVYQARTEELPYMSGVDYDCSYKGKVKFRRHRKIKGIYMYVTKITFMLFKS
jgi:hypothetical protein